MKQLQVLRAELPTSRLVEAPEPTLTGGQVLARVERFAFTANNITYGAAGDQIGYWRFFPPVAGDDDATEGWGVLPVWGFADIVASECADVPVGDRLYGYFPPATHLVLEPKQVSAGRFVDASAHRSQLPAGYNNYQRVLAEPSYDRAFDDERMLLTPLFMTSFFLWDHLKDEGWFGAKQIVLVSASSKTSVGLAYALTADDDAPPVVGLTSPRNVDLVRRMGVYEHAIAYPDVLQLDATQPTAIVDMAGNGALMAKLHTHLGDDMLRCVNVGMTHWEDAAPAPGIQAERSSFFFAPSQIEKRIKEWGPAAFAEKTSTFIRETAVRCREWMSLRQLGSLEQLEEIYPDVCRGELPADVGLVVHLEP